MKKEVSFKIYEDRGIKRIAIAMKINGIMKGWNMPLIDWNEKINNFK